jgi:chromosome segregation ATPase
MTEFLINFLAAGFERSFDKFKLELTNLLEKAIMSLNEQINELKAGQELNAQKLQSLIDASTQEREQVGGLITLSQEQQQTIGELTTKVNELLALNDANEAEKAAASEVVAALLATTGEQSSKIDEAIAGIQTIYNPPAV